MKRLLSAIDTFTDRAGMGTAFGILVIAGVTAYEVIARFAFNAPTMWAHQTAALLFGIYCFLTGGYVLLHERHVRVDVWWARLSPRGKAIADLATSGFAFLFIGALLWFAIPYAWHSFQIRQVAVTVFAPPLYPVKMLLVIGAFLFLLALVVKFVRDLYTAIRGIQLKD